MWITHKTFMEQIFQEMRKGVRWEWGEQDVELAQEAGKKLILHVSANDLNVKERDSTFNMLSFMEAHIDVFGMKAMWETYRSCKPFLSEKQRNKFKWLPEICPAETCLKPRPNFNSNIDSNTEFYRTLVSDWSNESFTPHTGWYTSGSGERVYQFAGDAPDYTACSTSWCGLCGRCDY